MMNFDFKECLQKLYPDVEYDIEELTSGRVNWTVRAKRIPSVQDSPDLALHDSIILKHAPPYVAKRGPDTPFRQSRQSTEAHALTALFNAREELQHSTDGPNIFPALLHFDPESHILILKDLGHGEDISRYLRTLRNETVADPEQLKKTWSNIGSQVGHFFAKLHSSTSLRCSKFPIKEDNSEFQLLYNTVIRPIRDRIAPFLPSNNEEVSELYRRVEEDFLRPNSQEELSFVHGDCYAYSILIINREIPRVIDWEFASIGRGPHGDIAQLLAHIHGRLIFLESGGEGTAAAGIPSLIQGIISAYRGTSTLPLDLLSHDDNGDVNKQKQELTAKMARSAFVIHGRDLINNATEWDWECRCCSNGDGFPLRCTTRAAIVEKGIFYLRAARESVESFAERDHLERITQEDHVLLPLFTGYNTSPEI